MVVELLAISVPRTAQLVASHAPLQRADFLRERKKVENPDGSGFITFNDELVYLRRHDVLQAVAGRETRRAEEEEEEEERQRRWAEQETELAGLMEKPQFTVKEIVDELQLAE